MKKLILFTVVFLSGCASFDVDQFSNALEKTLQIQQQNQQLMQQYQPQPVPRVEHKPTIMLGMLKTTTDKGTLRYCTYTNGVITTISVFEQCPLNNP